MRFNFTTHLQMALGPVLMGDEVLASWDICCMPRVHLCCRSSVSLLTIHYPHVRPGVGCGAGRRVAWSTVWVVGCHRYVSKVPSSCSNIISLFRRTTCLYLLSTVQPFALHVSTDIHTHAEYACAGISWISCVYIHISCISCVYTYTYQ
jgi:hypothetical protein